MSDIFYHKKSIKGFTLIEIMIVLSIFSITLVALLSVFDNNLIMMRKVYNEADIYNENKIINAKLTRAVNTSSSVVINSDNSGFKCVINGNPSEYFFKDGYLLKKTSNNISKVSFYKIDEADFIVNDGYLWGKIKISGNENYFEVKLP